jgi:hypothetical protein
MPHLALTATKHDPFWGMDGKNARRTRFRRKFVRTVVFVIAALVAVVLITRLPAIDPSFLMVENGRPLLTGVIFALLASTILLGLVRLRRSQR